MSVANGRALLATPGPTNIPERVLQAMMRPAEELHTPTIIDLTTTLLADLQKLFRTSGQTYLYACNGHGAWEAALTNVLSRGDKVLVLASGRFAIGWGEMASFMGVDVEILPGSWSSAVDPAAVETRLRQDRDHRIKAVLMAQVDTASGIANDVLAVRKAINTAAHPALYMIDGVASLACMPFEMDAWGVDVAMSASQKGLMTSPGLGFVAANDKAHKAHESADLKTRYWDWTSRRSPLHYMKHCGTPPEHLMFGLRASLDMIFEEGLEAVWKRHALLAGATHAAVSRWAEGQCLALNVEHPAQRAPSVTPVLTKGFEPGTVLEFTRAMCGVTLGGGLGDLSGKAFRIAHMGHVNAPMVLGSLAAVEMALQALEIPHGSGGTAAAIAHLSASVSPSCGQAATLSPP